MERKQNNLGEDPHAGTNKSETDPPPSFNGGADLGFGLRKKHRCFVVTARARAFLYHQVEVLLSKHQNFNDYFNGLQYVL